MFRPLAPHAVLLLTAAAATAAGPPETVTGTVLDAAGNPVAGADVGAVTPAGPDYTTRTAPDGTFSLPVHTEYGRPVLPDIIARGPGGDLGVGPERPKTDDFPATVRLAPPHRLAVAVAGTDGTPAAGVPVYALARRRPVASGLTGPDGRAELLLPRDAPLMQTVALKPGVGFAFTRHDLDGGPGKLAPTPNRVSLRLSPPAAHRVTVLAADPVDPDAPGTPLAGARVTAGSFRLPGESNSANIHADFTAVTTGPDGVAAFDWLPADVTGWISLSVSADGYERIRSFVPTGDSGDADIPDFNPTATPAAQTLTLSPTATFAGRVTLADGAPAAGVMVRAEGQNWDIDTNHYERDLAFTGPDGRWELEIRGRASYLVVPLPGSPSVYEEREPAGGLAAAALGRDEPVTVAPGGRFDGLDFVLTEGTRVTGTVTREGKPVADHTVGLDTRGAPAPAGANTVNGDRLGLPRWTKTDAAGRYAFRVGPGDHSLTLFDGEVVGGRDRRAIAAGDEPATITRNVVLEPEPKPTVVAGVVTDEYGLPLAGVIVTVADDRGDAVLGVGAATTTTDADGAFRLERTSGGGYGRWFLLATGFDDLRGPVTGFQEVDISAGDATGLAVAAGRVAVVAGRVTAGGAALAGIPVTLGTPGAYGNHMGVPFRFSALTGPDGRVVFRGPVGGAEYSLFTNAKLGPFGGVPTVTADADTPDLGVLNFGGAGLSVPPAADRRRWAFAPPADPAAVVKDLRADAAALGRHALLLVADPDSAAGRDLFAAPSMTTRTSPPPRTPGSSPAACGRPARGTAAARTRSPVGPASPRRRRR